MYDMPKLKIASWNIAGGRKMNSGQRYDYIANEDIDYFVKKLSALDPDIICFQEVHFKDGVSTASQIAKKLAMPHVFDSNAGHTSHIDANYQLGTAIISRLPLHKTTITPVPYPDFPLFLPSGEPERERHHRFLQTAQCQGFTVANLHTLPMHFFGLAYDKDKGKDFAHQIEDLLLATLKQPLLFAAELNFDDARLIYPRFYKELELSEALGTLPTRPDGRRTDHILYSPEFQLISSGAEETESDHYVCWTEFEVK
jgi:exonuclease III